MHPLPPKKPSVKILVGYHKPAVLLKNDILVPIHLGRALATHASKDGAMSPADYQWMLENMIGDDTADNISLQNRELNECTALYWAWKNYDKLGNPEYIGFMHYRRHLLFADKVEGVENGVKLIPHITDKYIEKAGLTPQQIYKTIQDSDTVVAQRINHHKTVKDQFDDLEIPPFSLNRKFFDQIIAFAENKFPSIAPVIDEYLNAKQHFWYNCFVMKKEHFFQYCSFLFGTLLPLGASMDLSEETWNGQRVKAYSSERLMGIFLSQLIKEGKNVKEVPLSFINQTDLPAPVLPFFSGDAVCAVFSCDNNYAPLVATALSSLKAHACAKNNYDIFIITEKLHPRNRHLLENMSTQNISVRVLDITPFIAETDKSTFFIHAHFTLATYYRFFIPRIFKNFKKILYLDSDLVILDDIAKLFATDIEGYAFGAAQDIEIQRASFMDNYYRSDWSSYLRDTLKLDHPAQYMQAGVLLFNIPKLLEDNFEKQAICACRAITPRLVDQCIINYLYKEKFKEIDLAWNVEWHLPLFNDPIHHLPANVYEKYIAAYQHPKIVHYCGQVKPTQHPSYPLAHYFWRYARQTDFYEELLHSTVSPVLLRPVRNSGESEQLSPLSLFLHYYRCKILSKITWGTKRAHYKQKREQLHAPLRRLRAILKTSARAV